MLKFGIEIVISSEDIRMLNFSYVLNHLQKNNVARDRVGSERAVAPFSDIFISNCWNSSHDYVFFIEVAIGSYVASNKMLLAATLFHVKHWKEPESYTDS